jgi:hypothetical protein
MASDPTNAATKAQLRDFFDKAIEKSRNPDPREKLKAVRKQKIKIVQKNYGF